MKKESVGSLFFLIVGFSSFFLSLKYGIGSLSQPGSAMFPLVLSISLCIIGTLLFISGSQEKRIDWRVPLKQFGRPLKIFVLTVGFILAFERLGFLATSFLYLLGLFLWVCRFRVWVAVLWAVLLTSASFYFFAKLLSVLLPMGPLRF
jgi:putative tricarboxylic transport membrane protein